MTRQKYCGQSHEIFSQWIRDECPDSKTGYQVSDLDFILWNDRKKTLMLLEVKINNAAMKEWQAKLFRRLDALFYRVAPDAGIKYLGLHYVTFTGADCDFKNGECYFDNERVSEDQLRELLSI